VRIPLTWLDVLLIFVPVAVVMEVAHAPGAWVFAASCLAIIPLAGWMGRATEHLAAHLGAAAGGLLNATFGNAAELIIAIMALRRGLYDVVKASLTGSIIGNVLLVLGLSLLLGGLRRRRQRFNSTAAGLGATLLALSAAGLLVPPVFHAVGGAAGDLHIQDLSLAIAVVLFVAYVLSLIFQLKTHQHLFADEGGHAMEHPWSVRWSMAALAGATALVALMSEMLVGSVEEAAHTWGMSDVFVGVILVAIIGNAAEHSSAVLMAMKDRMDLSMSIAVGSGIQIALFVAPLLIFLSYVIGPQPMDFEFTPFEVFSVAVALVVVNLVAYDGESHWMEGVLLLAVYLVLGIAFYFLPA
jgi:Ca2+:H+ antiporter